MKAIILARVSTEEQMNDGQSIPAQLARAQEYARRKSLTVVSEYQFDESSVKDKRTKFEKVISEIRKSKEKIVLIVETVDRLQRSFKESVMLDEFRKQDKLDLHFIREGLVIHKSSNSSELIRWDMAVMFARNFVLQISDNVKRTIDQKIKKGELAGKAPIGYLNVDDGNGGRTIIVDPIKSPYVIKVFETYATGDSSMERIADLLNSEGIVGKMGAKMRIRQIETILKNPFYYGFMNFKGQTYPHKYPPIITYDLFKACVAVREGYGKKPSKYSAKPFIFRGLMTCERCGCTITPELHKGRYVYYHCTNYKRVCEKIFVNEVELLKPVKKILRGIQLTQDQIDKLVVSLKATNDAKNEFQGLELNSLRSRYDILENRISVMYDDKLDGKIEQERYDKKLSDFKEQQADILFKMKQFDNASKTFYITADKVLSLAKRAEELFESSEVEEKRQLVNFLFLNLQMDGKKLLYKLKAPFDEVLVANESHLGGDMRESNPRQKHHKLL